VVKAGESESQVRRRLIDAKLRASGWEVTPFRPRRPHFGYDRQAVTEFPTDNGPADYALFLDGRAVGVVEAKKLTIGPQGVLTQAERYARGLTDNFLTFGAFRAPFLYSTNGEVTWFHDVRNTLNVSRKVAQFHAPDALNELLTRDLDREGAWLRQNPIRHVLLRPYQVEAIAAVEQAILARKRQMLVAMATGTGKTLTMVSQVYRLMKSGVARRVLFLVDRRALAAQAVRAFASFEAEPGRKLDQIYEVYSQRFQQDDLDEDGRFDPRALPKSYLQNPQPGLAFVYVCTIQRMAINLFGPEVVFGMDGEEPTDADDVKLPIPSHAFDLIIADECHRGYTTSAISVWRNTLDHFDAIKVGLTATPAAHESLLQGRGLPLRVRARRPRGLPRRLRRGDDQVRRPAEGCVPEGRGASRPDRRGDRRGAARRSGGRAAV
jgi:type I restriction enzyme R subunit